eukprot:364789-Chlamydomonas_euryale.AAC.19
MNGRQAGRQAAERASRQAGRGAGKQAGRPRGGLAGRQAGRTRGRASRQARQGGGQQARTLRGGPAVMCGTYARLTRHVMLLHCLWDLKEHDAAVLTRKSCQPTALLGWPMSWRRRGPAIGTQLVQWRTPAHMHGQAGASKAALLPSTGVRRWEGHSRLVHVGSDLVLHSPATHTLVSAFPLHKVKSTQSYKSSNVAVAAAAAAAAITHPTLVKKRSCGHSVIIWSGLEQLGRSASTSSQSSCQG